MLWVLNALWGLLLIVLGALWKQQAKGQEGMKRWTQNLNDRIGELEIGMERTKGEYLQLFVQKSDFKDAIEKFEASVQRLEAKIDRLIEDERGSKGA